MTRDLSPDELAFREAINASSKDDTPKLVYADWLDEHGHPEQAKKVRLRTERGQLREAAWTEKVIPTKSFDIDWGGVDLPSHRFALGMIYKAMGDDATIDNHIREMAWAEQSYFQACLYACFGKRATERST